MSQNERMERLYKLSTEIFIMANSFSGDRGPRGVASILHESVNNIHRAQRILKGEEKPGIPVEFIARACGLGLGMGTSMLDLQIKDEQYAEDLEKKTDG
jgi:hypothetical protein